MPFQRLLIHTGAKRQLIHGQLARVLHPFQQLRSGAGKVQHAAARGKGPLLPGTVIRHI